MITPVKRGSSARYLQTWLAWPATLLLCLLPAMASSASDGRFPDNYTLDQQPLVKNGAGVREYGWLKIAVYRAALYLPERSSNAEAILAATTPRLIRMQLLRDVSQSDSRKAWHHYLQANCVAPCVLAESSLARFEALVPESRAGDSQDWLFRDGKLELYRNGSKLGEISDPVFARTVLAGWIGKVPTTEALKAALLGQPGSEK